MHQQSERLVDVGLRSTVTCLLDALILKLEQLVRSLHFSKLILNSLYSFVYDNSLTRLLTTLGQLFSLFLNLGFELIDFLVLGGLKLLDLLIELLDLWSNLCKKTLKMSFLLGQLLLLSN